MSSQVWAISNEGDEGSIVLSSIAEQGRSHAETGIPSDLSWFEWSAEPDRARTDPVAWQQSNPALGYLVSADTIRSEAELDDPIVFETEVLCRRVVSLRPWLPPGVWEACAGTEPFCTRRRRDRALARSGSRDAPHDDLDRL